MINIYRHSPLTTPDKTTGLRTLAAVQAQGSSPNHPARHQQIEEVEMSGIDGKVVAITGASSGIGEATARAVAFAIEQPHDIEIGDITIRPTVQG
ncbi:hypothetical protein E2F47_20035 [Mycobacterium eburneum]|nr:hypothetical protein E2F47_20035 [Mycobacterium eburneum]